MTLLIKGGRVLNPATNTDKILDVFIEDGKIKEVAEQIDKSADEVVDAAGCFVMPGFIDLHVHFRDPGLTYKEDIETGSKAAAKGGFTGVFPMPNTKPVADSPEVIKYVTDKANEVGLTKVYQVGSVTVGMMGKEVSDIKGMKDAGIVAISEDGKSVMDSAVYRKAMKQAAELDLVVLAHCEDINLVEGGVMNAGKKAEELGVNGITNAVEDIIAVRDIMLAEETGARLHLCHCSTKASVEYVRQAKEAGLKVSGEVCPHHFTLCEDDIPGNDGNYKMNPPLRAREDMEALKCALRDGVMDVISTDHAPHSEEEKSRGFASAFGIVGLETSAALTYTELVLKDYLTPLQMAEKMSYNPAKIAGLSTKGSIEENMDADIVVFDPEKTYKIDPETFVSKGKNTPFGGREVTGDIKFTILGGKIVYQSV